MEFDFRKAEENWNKRWENSGLYVVEEDYGNKKYPQGKYYVLDMFPYPSGSGLHVGHPLGYVASDIVARYKKLKGFNVLHPMGFDAFGLPAEQYAVETGQHPAITTKKNIQTFRDQLKRMGFSYDWSREVQTMDPDFYKWTQWIFMQLFKSWFNPDTNKAEEITLLINLLEAEGSKKLFAAGLCDALITSGDWKNSTEEERQKFLMQFRLAYLSYAEVWYCEALGTVLANDEVKDGVSERGGHPVERIKMRQWFLRITAYAERLLQGLETLDWSDAMKDMQRNWIGKSEGALVRFKIQDIGNATNGKADEIEIFTTRPDTIFGATFMVLAPEHTIVPHITTAEYKDEVEKYIQYVKSRSERDRMSEVKKVTGQFTGAYALNPFTNNKIPIYIAEYVLAGYGTGAIMAVPGHDDRDHAFAMKFDLPIINVVDQHELPNAAREDKKGRMINSDLLNGLEVMEAIQKMLDEIEKKKIGQRKINYRLRDAGFSRQRYWGEPFPVVYKNDIPYLLDENELPLLLPEVNSYKPSGAGKSPLASITDWTHLPDGSVRETDTMPGYAGSSWYMLRYMDVHNRDRFVGEQQENYWRNVDLYIGGTEHAVGHLLYSRLWQNFLYDRGWVHEHEPFKKLVNQGMIQGQSKFVYRVLWSTMSYQGDFNPPPVFISKQVVNKLEVDPNDNFDGKRSSELELILNNIIHDKYPQLNSGVNTIRYTKLHVDINLVNDMALDKESFKKSRDDYNNAIFVNDDFSLDPNGVYTCGGIEVEKMSKSKYNVVNPDDVIAEYGADCFRLYEMFLGPLDASKPWDTKGITGVQGFIRKLWRLCVDENGVKQLIDAPPSAAELKALHKTIKKTGEDIERLSFNTAVSAFMICVNELTALKCNNRSVLKDLLVILAPFAPYITEELWMQLNGYDVNTFDKTKSVHVQPYPVFNETYLTESSVQYPVSINGKTRITLELPADLDEAGIQQTVLGNETVVKWMEGKQPKKIIIVRGKIVNVVV